MRIPEHVQPLLTIPMNVPHFPTRFVVDIINATCESIQDPGQIASLKLDKDAILRAGKGTVLETNRWAKSAYRTNTNRRNGMAVIGAVSALGVGGVGAWLLGAVVFPSVGIAAGLAALGAAAVFHGKAKSAKETLQVNTRWAKTIGNHAYQQSLKTS